MKEIIMKVLLLLIKTILNNTIQLTTFERFSILNRFYKY